MVFATCPLRTDQLRTCAFFVAALLFGACDSKTTAVDEPDIDVSLRSIEAIADDYLAAMLERFPSVATSYSIEGARHDRLYDNSLAALDSWQKREDSWLTELDAIGEPLEIGSRDWVTYGILHEQLASAQASRICRTELWETSTTTAWYNELPVLHAGCYR